MSTPPQAPVESNLQETALSLLRRGTNPFSTVVAAVGNTSESIATTVPELASTQLDDLLSIVRKYRDEQTATRLYPVVGDTGTGKTHLLHIFLEELRRQGSESGDETMAIVVDRLAKGVDPIDYLLWQIVNHLLARKGEGSRMLGVVAARLTARLLGEALRHMGPHQQAELIPLSGWRERIRKLIGSAAPSRKRIEAVNELIQRCSVSNLSDSDLGAACDSAGIPPAKAIEIIEKFLERTESKDIKGWLRKELYRRLAKVVLQNDRVGFEDFHNGEYEAGPANVKEYGNVSRTLLTTWLELFATLRTPVIVIFDQLEDYLRAPTSEEELERRKHFSQAITSFVDKVPSVAVVLFAELGIWTDLINNSDEYARGRLTQRFALPGKPSQEQIVMPSRLDLPILEELIRRRVKVGFPDLNLTGLPPSFPFASNDLKSLSNDTVRESLRKLAKRYDQIVFADTLSLQVDGQAQANRLRERLLELWNAQVRGVATEHGSDLSFSTAFIANLQTALDGWLRCLMDEGLNGSGPWDGIKLVTDSRRNQYGYLNLIRTNGPNAPGIGVAAWLGTRAAKLWDLQSRLEFFSDNPCLIQTLILLRADGNDALTGQSGTTFRKAQLDGRDVRVCKYTPEHFHSLMAFTPWHQLAVQEVWDAEHSGNAEARATFRAFLSKLSGELLGWVDDWRKSSSLEANT